MTHTDCMRCAEAGVGRRDFLRVGSLGLLGISLRNYLMAAEGFGAQGQGQGLHPAVAGGWAQPSRHLGSQAE